MAALRKRAAALGKKYDVNPYPISQAMDEMVSQDVDEQAIDWDVIVQDTKDLGITVANLWGKIAEYYELTRPLEAVSKIELQTIEQRAAEYERTEVQQMFEDAIARVIEAERDAITSDIYNSIKQLVEDVPAESKRSQALLKAAIASFEETIAKRDAEVKEKITTTVKDLKDAAEFTLKAEIGCLRAKLQEGLTAPRSRPALRKAQERLKAPSPAEELAPEGFIRERAISTSELERDPLHPEKTIEVLRCIEIPREISIFRSPDGRLYRVRDSRLTEVTKNDVLKLISPITRRPLAVGPSTREIMLGVPIFQPGVKHLDLGEVLRKFDVIKARDPEFVDRAKAEGRTLQEIVEEYERTRGAIE